jgi:hypothetical protein
MGLATEFAESLEGKPLSQAELEERREGARVRESVTTTLEGGVVERIVPKVAPKPIHQPEPRTWD